MCRIINEKLGQDLDSRYFQQVEQHLTVATDIKEFLEIIHSLVDDIDRNFFNFGEEDSWRHLETKPVINTDSVHLKNLRLQVKFANEYQKMISQVKKEISDRFQLVTEYKKGLWVNTL